MDWSAIGLSVQLATVVSFVLLIIGLPAAYWLTFSRWRWKFLVEAIVALPLVLPPTVLGFYILVSLGPASPIGRWYVDAFGHTLPFSVEGLDVASVLYRMPLAFDPVRASSGWRSAL